MGLPSSNIADRAKGITEQGTDDSAKAVQNNLQSAAADGARQGSGAGLNTGAGITREQTQAEREADLAYEEAIEEEYAKREGGA